MCGQPGRPPPAGRIRKLGEDALQLLSRLVLHPEVLLQLRDGLTIGFPMLLPLLVGILADRETQLRLFERGHPLRALLCQPGETLSDLVQRRLHRPPVRCQTLAESCETFAIIRQHLVVHGRARLALQISELFDPALDLPALVEQLQYFGGHQPPFLHVVRHVRLAPVSHPPF